MRTRLGSVVFSQKRQKKIEHLFERHGMKTVFLGRFIPAVRFGVFFFAGRHQMDLKKFLGLNAVGALVYAPLWIWLSAVAGERFARTPAAARLAEQWVGQEAGSRSGHASITWWPRQAWKPFAWVVVDLVAGHRCNGQWGD